VPGASSANVRIYQTSTSKFRPTSRLIELGAHGRAWLVAEWQERFLGVDEDSAGVFWSAGWDRSYRAVEVKRWSRNADRRGVWQAEIAQEVDLNLGRGRTEGDNLPAIGVTALKVVPGGAWLGTFTHGVAWSRFGDGNGPPRAWLRVGSPDRDGARTRPVRRLAGANVMCSGRW
jgi:hypothetical protein